MASTRSLLETALREWANSNRDGARAAQAVLQSLPYLDGEADCIELVDRYARAPEQMTDGLSDVPSR
jgi:hypothetical protein